MSRLKEKRGITLIALIITIIVLLILAGVVINMTLGNDGIINKAQGAVDMYKNAQEKEEATLNTIEDVILDEKMEGARDWVSADISDFIPVIKSVKSVSIEATVPENIANNRNIAGYIFLLNGEVKELSKNNTYKFMDLQPDTEYIIKIIAVDKNGKFKLSSDNKQKTENATYLYKYGVKENTMYTRGDKYSTVSYESNYLRGESSEEDTMWTATCLFTINKMNLNNISKIYVHFYDVNLTENVSLFVSAYTNLYNGEYMPANCFSIDKKVNQNINNGQFTLELDTSNLTGEYYIGFGGITTKNFNGCDFNNNYAGSVSFKIDKVWY